MDFTATDTAELTGISQWSVTNIFRRLDFGFGKLMMPLRPAVSGMGFGRDLTPTIELLGKETTIRRINTAIEKLG